MRVMVLKKSPSCAHILRTMTVGEEKNIKLLGMIYNTMISTRGRLRKEGLDYLFKVDAQNNTMAIKRVK